jgi:hypothetical protein
MIYIAAAPTHSDGYSFAIGLYTYGHVIFRSFHTLLPTGLTLSPAIVAVGLVKLQKHMKTSSDQDYQLTFFKNKSVLYSIPFIFAAANVVILGFAGKERSAGKIARFWWPVTIAILPFVSFVYWAGIWLTTVRTKRLDGTGNEMTVGDIIGFKVMVYNADTAPPRIRDSITEKLASQIDGSTRRVEVLTSG